MRPYGEHPIDSVVNRNKFVASNYMAPSLSPAPGGEKKFKRISVPLGNLESRHKLTNNIPI